MKNIKRLVAVAVAGLSICGQAIAQNSNGSSTDPAQHHQMDPAAMVKHFTEVFPQIAAFDLNKDGKLDETERQALGKALADGKLQLAPHLPADSAKANPEMMRNHIAEMYALVAVYDVNKDGKLDETEQAALKSAIEKGEFAARLKPQQHAENQH